MTPKIFRTEKYGGNRISKLDVFSPQKSRLYSYVMDEYSEACNIMRDLPHRDLSFEDWDKVCNNIGWLTFDDIHEFASKNKTIKEYEAEFVRFFKDRNLI